MKKTAIVCCGKRDESMLPIFVRRWQELYPDVELWLADDVKDPVSIAHDLPIVAITWGKGIAKTIVNAMLKTGGDIVAKLDVDAWHVKPNLFDPFDHSWVKATGHQWKTHAGRFLGIAYAARREALMQIEIMESCEDMRGAQEDTAMSQSLRRLHPNGIYLFPYMQCRRSDTWDGVDASVIHCGLYGHDDSARDYALEEMERLENGSKPSAKESAHVGISVMPSRLHQVESIVDRLQSNTIAPSSIILSIPRKAGRVDDEYDESIVAKLAEKANVARCADYGPITKYIGLCEQLQNPKELCAICDDDNDYSCQLIERMISEYKGGTVLANKTITITHTTLPEGFRAVMFRRNLIDLRKLKNLVRYLSNEFPEAILADDAVMGWFLQSQGIPVVAMKKPVASTPLPSNYDECAIHKIGGGNVDRYQKTIRFLNINRISAMAAMNG